MDFKTLAALYCAAIIAAVSLSAATHAQTTPFTKPQVADRIRKVEDGVDQFQKYLENRGARHQEPGGIGTEQRSNNGPPAFKFSQHGGPREPSQADKRRSRECHGRSESHTNRLRRKFDPTSNYLETKAQMEQVMDSARRVNQVMVKGNYGTQAEKYWAALRANINDLARCYNLTPMGS